MFWSGLFVCLFVFVPAKRVNTAVSYTEKIYVDLCSLVDIALVVINLLGFVLATNLFFYLKIIVKK